MTSPFRATTGQPRRVDERIRVTVKCPRLSTALLKKRPTFTRTIPSPNTALKQSQSKITNLDIFTNARIHEKDAVKLKPLTLAP
jgi:hypothetical protein